MTGYVIDKPRVLMYICGVSLLCYAAYTINTIFGIVILGIILIMTAVMVR